MKEGEEPKKYIREFPVLCLAQLQLPTVRDHDFGRGLPAGAPQLLNVLYHVHALHHSAEDLREHED